MGIVSKNVDDHLCPLITTNNSPEKLLSFIICTFNKGYVRNFECQRSGLKCSNKCQNFSGYGCTNTDFLIFNDVYKDYYQNEEDFQDLFPITDEF